MTPETKPEEASPSLGTGDRVAHPKSWYVAHVRSCCEKKVAQRLAALGTETYVPLQTEIRQWSDRKKKIEVVLIPMMVFLHVTPEELSEIRKNSFIYGILRAPGQNKPATIPDDQMDRLRFMVDNSESPIEFTSQDFSAGDRITITQGTLKGLEGFVRESSGGKARIGIVIDFLGCATLQVPRSHLALTRVS